MNEKLFNDFSLVGGTALALQMGHRNSIDIDLFGNCHINKDLFSEKLSEFGAVKIINYSKNIFICNLDSIKIDFVNYSYPILSTPATIGNIRMLSKKDIAAMKLNAISGRGSKKDFIDLYYLLDCFSLKEMIDFYTQKYKDGSEFLVLKSLTYFDDADNQPNPIMFDEKFNWENCKEKIKTEILKMN